MSGLFRTSAQASDSTRRITVVAAVDISGSMRTVDAVAREAYKEGKRMSEQFLVSRWEAVKYDVLFHYEQLQRSKRADDYVLVLFGQDIHVSAPKSFEELAGILNDVQLEGYTRTDLAIEECNIRFRMHLKNREEDQTFVTIVYTDGAPSGPGMTEEAARVSVAEALARGTLDMPSDVSRATTFIQYGTTNYNPDSTTSKFLEYLDDHLDEVTRRLCREKIPSAGAFTLYNTVDTGKQCMPWFEVDPNVRGRPLTMPWDTRIDDIVTRAVSN